MHRFKFFFIYEVLIEILSFNSIFKQFFHEKILNIAYHLSIKNTFFNWANRDNLVIISFLKLNLKILIAWKKDSNFKKKVLSVLLSYLIV